MDYVRNLMDSNNMERGIFRGLRGRKPQLNLDS